MCIIDMVFRFSDQKKTVPQEARQNGSWVKFHRGYGGLERLAIIAGPKHR